LIKKIKYYFWYEEGKRSHFLSIGWGFDNTAFMFCLRVPIFLCISSFFDNERYGINNGLHVYWVGFSFRIRSLKQWRKSKKLMLFHFYNYWNPVRKYCSFIGRKEFT
jgi:hypothetical protein